MRRAVAAGRKLFTVAQPQSRIAFSALTVHSNLAFRRSSPMIWPHNYPLVNTTIRAAKARCARIFAGPFPERASKIPYEPCL